MRPKLNAQVYEEASEWLVEFRAGDADAAARRRFDAWLRRSPENLGAYLELAAIWNEGNALDPQSRYDTETLIAQAAQDRSNIVTLAQAARPSRRLIRPRRPLLLAASLLAVAAGLWLVLWLHHDTTYSTQIGEQRSIALRDGTTIDLNSRSSMRVRLTERERIVDLLEGQALFKVAKDPSRPFVVNSGSTRVRVVGTSFDVYRKRSGTVVTVVEGRVAVEAKPGAGTAQGAGRGIVLDAGEQANVTSARVEKSEHADIVMATAWTQRRLVFESATLGHVVEEFNRYNERQIVIGDAKLYDFHISGIFSSTDPSSLVRFLRERRGVRVTETDTTIRIDRR
jgi:transmembrane sensor